MLELTATELRDLLDWPSLITAIEAMFREGCKMPTRHHHSVDVPGSETATLLLMPAWVPGRYIGVKLVDIFPGNARTGLPSVNAIYTLFAGDTGQALCLLNGDELTARRTAAASALAARYLARKDAATILVVGTGRVADNLARVHAAERPGARLAIWGRNADKAGALVAQLRDEGIAASVATDLAAAASTADIVSCATLSEQPLIRGAWLRPGTHLDLVGGFTPTRREADDEAVRRASVFVDTRAGAGTEAGDIVEPMRKGVLAADGIRADLFELARGAHPGRQGDQEITLFKSVGAALEDLAAAALAYERLTGAAAGAARR